MTFSGIRAVLLDIDGTVLDTNDYIVRAIEHTLHEFGYEVPPREELAKTVGLPFDETYYAILGRCDIDVLPLQTTHRAFQLENLDLSQPFPNSIPTLTELKKRGYALCAITSRRRSTLMPTLDKDGLTPLFDHIIAADDAPVLKPSPVPLEIALERMRMVPEEAIMVGDTDIDMQAGKAAGVKTARAWYAAYARSSEIKADADLEKDISELLEFLPPIVK
jgi:HAD superfamily hydrolase (TIGR01549 family)